MSQVSYFPQALLLFNCTKKIPVDVKKSVLVDDLLNSQLGLQKKIILAKLKGDYIPEAAVSKVITPKKPKQVKEIDKNFLHLENYKITSLVPEIRIYRREDKTEQITPFYFPISADYQSDGAQVIDFKNKSFSSNAASIQSFSVTYTGKNPYQASKKFLEASLSITVDNISILFDEKPNGAAGKYAPLSDLFTIRSVGSKSKSTTVLGMKKEKPASALESGESCNIIVSLGYSNHLNDVIAPHEMRTIQDNRMLINLYYRSHDLNLNTNGSATINVTYQGYLEAKSGNPLYDFIMPAASKGKFAKDKTSLDKKKDKKSIKNPDSSKKLSEKEKKAKLVKEREVERARIEAITQTFFLHFSEMYNTKRVHTTKFMNALVKKKVIEASKEDKDFSNKVGTHADGVKFRNYDFFDQELTFEPKNPYAPLHANLIHYVTFGDFIDAYFKRLVDDLNTAVEELADPDLVKRTSEEYKKTVTDYVNKHKDDLKKINILFADVSYSIKAENKSDERKKIINIADIPISVDMIYTLMYDELISKRKTFLDIDEFLDSFAPKLLNRAFGTMQGADFIRDITFVVTNYSAQPIQAKDIKDNEILPESVPRPTGKTSTKNIKNLKEYYIFHQKPADYNKAPGSGNKKKDLGKGIFHLRANQDRGLVKNISFSKISQPARETYMIFRNGQMYDELRYPHNATVEMYGNNLFMPTSQIYINPDTLGFGDPRGLNSAARRLGFGGYYTAESVTTTYSGGALSTVVQLFFNSFPDSSDESSLPASVARSIKELEGN